jgi:hypothetical protein
LFSGRTAAGGLNASLRNQAFQLQHYIKILLELPFIFSILSIRRLKKRLFKALCPAVTAFRH